MQRTDHEITLPNNEKLPGANPIVLVGPNGSGKTRFGADLANRSQGSRIPALRSLNISSTIQPKSVQQARQEVANKTSQYISQVFQQAEELNEMLSELKAEQADAAIQFQENWTTDPANARPAQTRLASMLSIWQEVFPGRTLDLKSYEPQVKATHLGGEQVYRPNTMSDGERAALYLIPSVLRAPSGVVVVDEPEVHFHTLLARTFWDTLERQRPDCRFVFVTHDLQFALSRRGADIGIVSNPTTVQFINKEDGIPADLVEMLLGAASLSLVAKRIIFTEGIPGASIDSEFYGAWFQAPGTTVVSVGDCRRVQEAVRVFQSKVLTNVEPLGIIERDYWPDTHLASLATKPGLFVLKAHEIEGLLCYSSVASALMTHLGVAPADIAAKYVEFEGRVRSLFVGGRLHKHVLERVKIGIDAAMSGTISSVTPSGDAASLRSGVAAAFATSVGAVNPEGLFDAAMSEVTGGLADGADTFLRLIPGKDCLKILTGVIGISEDVYLTTITAALRPPKGTDPDNLATLRAALEAALGPMLPPRE